jgi:hypothetical protein
MGSDPGDLCLKLPPYSGPLFFELVPIWYPGFNNLNRPDVAARWDQAKHSVWKDRYDHDLEAHMRFTGKRPINPHSFRLVTNGLGPNMSPEMLGAVSQTNLWCGLSRTTSYQYVRRTPKRTRNVNRKRENRHCSSNIPTTPAICHEI